MLKSSVPTIREFTARTTTETGEVGSRAVHHSIGASHEPARPSSLLIVVEAEAVHDTL
jgi:hypothetical protein